MLLASAIGLRTVARRVRIRGGSANPDKMTYFARLVAVLILPLLSACAAAENYTPTPSRPFEPITEFSSTNSVTLLNGQPSKEQVKVQATIYADLNAWTDVAIEIASRELKRRGLKIVSGAPKAITMSVQSAKTDVGFVRIETDITMEVRTSDGYSETYVGRNSSSMVAENHRQIDGALMRAVHEMLMDPRIVAFLTK